MQLMLSNRKPHSLGLSVAGYEFDQVNNTLKHDIYGLEKAPPFSKMERNGYPVYVFKLPLKILDQILLTFPQAEVSDKLSLFLIRKDEQEFKRLHANPPVIETPNWTDDPNCQLYDFQRVGVAFGEKRLLTDSAFPLTDDMGVGKTPTSLALTDRLEAYPCLVITTKSGKYKWEKEIKKFLPALTSIIVDGNATQRVEQIEADSHFTIINYASLRTHPELSEIKWETVIVDEFHYIKNPKAKQTKAFHKIQPTYKIGLSGTPMLNGRPEELWSILKWMYPNNFTTYSTFVKYITLTPGQFKPIAYRNLHKIRVFLHERNLRRRKSQVLTSLPPTVEKIVEVDLLPEQRKVYEEAEQNMKLWMADGQRKTIAQALHKSLRLKQICFSPELYGGSESSTKVEEVKRIVETLHRTHEKVIIFSEFSTATKILQKELEEYHPAYVDGSISAKKRSDEQDRFQNDEDCRVYIGTIGANKEVIDLFAASYVIFVDRDWTPAYNEQAIARAWRNGQQKQVTVIILVGRDTVEMKFEEKLKNKSKMNSMMTEKNMIGAWKATPDVIGIEDIKQLIGE